MARHALATWRHRAPNEGRATIRNLAIATVFAGVAGYVVILLATLTLGAQNFDVFNVFWAAFFTLSGIVQGLMHETTRSVGAADVSSVMTSPMNGAGQSGGGSVTVRSDAADTPNRAKPIRVAGWFAAGWALLVAATSPLWAAAMFPAGHSAIVTVLLTVSVCGFALQSAVGGLLSGREQWNSYALIVGGEALLRLVAGCVAYIVGGGTVAFYFVTVAGIVTTPLLLLLPRVRAPLALVADVSPREFVRHTLQAMAAASAATVLVVGFPVLVRLTHPDASSLLSSNLLLAVLLTRAPILVPLQAFQNAIVVYFVKRKSQGRRSLLVPVAAIITIGVVGAGAAWLVGPWLFSLMGDGFAISGELLALLTIASSFTGTLFVTGAATLAMGHHNHYLLGWWIAIATVIITLVLVQGLVQATTIALLVGPALGAIWHGAVGMRTARRVSTGN